MHSMLQHCAFEGLTVYLTAGRFRGLPAVSPQKCSRSLKIDDYPSFPKPPFEITWPMQFNMHGKQSGNIHTYSDSNRTGNFNDFDGWWTKVKIFCWVTDLNSRYTMILCPAVRLGGHDTSVLGKPRWANFLRRKQGYLQTDADGRLKVHTFLDVY
jgi:hypothetical protein